MTHSIIWSILLLNSFVIIIVWPSKDFESVWSFYSLDVHEQVNIVCYIWSDIKDLFSIKNELDPELFWLLLSMPYVCSFLSLKISSYFKWDCNTSCSPLHCTPEHKTLVLQSFFPLESVVTWRLQWLRQAPLKQMFNYKQEQSNQKKKG